MDEQINIGNSGYIHVEPALGNYIHGDNMLGTVPLVPGGQWDAFLPEQHQQNENGFEPYDCVTEATINCTETLEIQEYGTNTKLARRFLAKNSNTDKFHGNDPQNVSETLRTGGCVGESDYPFRAPDFNTFYQAISKALMTLGIGRFAEYAYGHSWVNANPADMMAALEYSPLSAAGFAWNIETTTGYYTSPAGTSAGHDFEVYGYEINNFWKVRDSYAPFEKKLAWDYQFTGVKRHTLHRQAANTPAQVTAWNKFLTLLYSILGLQQGLSFGVIRSPQWEAMSRAYRIEQPLCESGMHKPTLLNPLNTHHVAVFHEHPELELVKSNWINLCRFHHLWDGHLGNWKSNNSTVREDATTFTLKVKNRPL